MSKARSPRDVCSTTMGTSGLMLLALFRSSIRIPAGGPHGVGDGSEEPTNRLFAHSTLGGRCACGGAESLRTRGPDLLSGAFGLALLGRPQLVAHARLLRRDRLGVLGEERRRWGLGGGPPAPRGGGRLSGAARAASRAGCPRARPTARARRARRRPTPR